MTEADVALTDYGLTIECVLFAWLLFRLPTGNPVRPPFVGFFVALALGSLMGGTVHGFFLDPASAGSRILWPATLLAIGATALMAWMAGARLAFSLKVARRISVAAATLFAAYTYVVLFVSRIFLVAIVHYLPSALFLLAALLVAYARKQERVVLAGVAGMLLTFVASAVQIAHLGIHPRYFNHNALYHLIQAVALFLLFLSARRLARTEA